MKKTLSFLFLLIAIISIPAVSLAALKTVTIDWTIADTTGVLGYKLYHSYNSDMGDKMLACETNDTTATSLTCANVPIDNYPVYFTIAAVTADSEINSQVDQYIYTVKVVQNFIVTTPGGTITPPEPPPTQPPSERVTEGLFLLYYFRAGSGNTVYDISNIGSAMDLTIDDINKVTWLDGGGLSINQSTIISSGIDSKITTECMTNNEITLEAWIKPANNTQAGPARIVTLSKDKYNRNFTLGQTDSRYDMRLRTTATGLNGDNPSTTTGINAVKTSLSHIIYTRDATGQARVYVDGTEVVSAAIDGDLSNWDKNYQFALGNEPSIDDRPWLGEYHLIGVYSRALTAEEVMLNYNAGP